METAAAHAMEHQRAGRFGLAQQKLVEFRAQDGVHQRLRIRTLMGNSKPVAERYAMDGAAQDGRQVKRNGRDGAPLEPSAAGLLPDMIPGGEEGRCAASPFFVAARLAG